MAFNLRAPFAQIPEIKPSYNIGALLDIPTGVFLKGRHGEHILNGGLAAVTGVVGIGNNFKSTMMHYMMLQAMARFMWLPEEQRPTAGTYDTEMNVMKSRLAALADNIDGLEDLDVVGNEIWSITDKTLYFANEWYEVYRTYVKEKLKSAKQLELTTPFLDPKTGQLMPMLIPSFFEIDSFTEFESENVAEMQETNELGSSKANTLFMKQGMDKTRFLSDIPKHVHGANTPLLLSAHIGKMIGMDPHAAPIKKTQFLKNGDVTKGTSDKFWFLILNGWQATNAAPYINDTTKGAEYPSSSDEVFKGDTDLMIVNLLNLRSKVGPSGFILQLLISQKEGVLNSLSEFHYCKLNNRHGLGGNDRNYYLELMPEVALSRTTVRGKLHTRQSDPEKELQRRRLRRAMNITSEMCQMTYSSQYKEHLAYMCTPLELYEKLKAKGYDWNVLLDTRGWWTANNDDHPIPFLSTKDLLLMAQDKYFPYWMDEKTKQPKAAAAIEKIKAKAKKPETTEA